jgi:hypothetical protein
MAATSSSPRQEPNLLLANLNLANLLLANLI